jgi:hypothetical protein
VSVTTTRKCPKRTLVLYLHAPDDPVKCLEMPVLSIFLAVARGFNGVDQRRNFDDALFTMTLQIYGECREQVTKIPFCKWREDKTYLACSCERIEKSSLAFATSTMEVRNYAKAL